VEAGDSSVCEDFAGHKDVVMCEGEAQTGRERNQRLAATRAVEIGAGEGLDEGARVPSAAVARSRSSPATGSQVRSFCFAPDAWREKVRGVSTSWKRATAP
jgi:hypothetical protein